MKRIEKQFTDMLQKSPSETKAIFILTAANSPDAIDVLPTCLNDLGLLKCGLDVHCNDEIREKARCYVKDRKQRIKLGNTQTVAVKTAPGSGHISSPLHRRKALFQCFSILNVFKMFIPSRKNSVTVFPASSAPFLSSAVNAVVFPAFLGLPLRIMIFCS